MIARIGIAFEVGRIAGFFHEIGDIEEGVAFKPYIDERALHARQHAGHAPVVNRAGERVLILAFVVDLGQRVGFDDGKAGLMRGGRYVNLFRHCVILLSALPGLCRFESVQAQIESSGAALAGARRCPPRVRTCTGMRKRRRRILF